MADAIVTRCGMRCDLCVAYKDNPANASREERQRAGDVWEKYFGFRVDADEVKCGGCLGEAEELLDKGCPVRACVVAHNHAHCAQCGGFEGCSTLGERLIGDTGYGDKEWGELPDGDRPYMEPFLNQKRLGQMRKRS